MNTQPLNIFTKEQLDNIKKIITSQRLWGDCDMFFGTDTENQYYAFGFITNLKLGKSWSGICSGLSKTIAKSNTTAFNWCSDYWQDGSGDVLFVNMDLFDCSIDELISHIQNG